MKKIKALIFLGASVLPFSVNAQFEDRQTVHYDLERNDPKNSGLYGVIINPVSIDLSSLNANIGASLGFFYTYKSKFGISGNYYISYLDNAKGQGQKGEPYGTTDSYGVPVAYKKTRRFEVQTKFNILSWEKEGNYHLKLGYAGYRTIAVGRVEGTIFRALTGRIGYMADTRIIESEGGIPFRTLTPEYEYHYNGEVIPLALTNLSSSSTMLRSNVMAAGVGLTTYRDIKIMLDGSRYTGRREIKSQVDFYLDLLYAHKLELQDMVYYHSLFLISQEYSKLPHRLDLSPTLLNKIGGRIGYQSIDMYRPHFGTKFAVEAGLRPGLKEDKIANGYLQITFGLIFGGRAAAE